VANSIEIDHAENQSNIVVDVHFRERHDRVLIQISNYDHIQLNDLIYHLRFAVPFDYVRLVEFYSIVLVDDLYV
jgi:hypothetical protein